MDFSELQLLYLRKFLVENLELLNRRLQRNLRFFGDADDILKQRKIGNLEAEIAVMSEIKEKVNLEIGQYSLAHCGENQG